MKRIALILIYNLCLSFLCAQTNYYTESTTFNEDDYIYQIDVLSSGFVELYNQDNQWIGSYPMYKSNGTIFVQPEYGYIDLYDNDSWADSENKMNSIIKGALTIAEQNSVKGSKLYIELHINSTTGKVDDVKFSFSNRNSWVNISVPTYRKMEVQIKDQLFYNLTDDGRKLTYIFTWNSIEF